MEFYKKIASIIHTEEIDIIKKSLIDRFGKIPDEVLSLFFLSEIRILCKKLNINEMIESSEMLEIKFSNVSDLNMQNLMKTINSSKGEIFLKPKYPNSLFIKLKKFEDLTEKGDFIKKTLMKIIS